MSQEVETKKCSKCQEIKSIHQFSKNSSRKDGLECYCKECVAIKSKSWQLKNPEKMKENSKRWAKANPEKVAAKSKHWRKNNPDKVYKMKLNWNQKNPEKMKENSKRWAKANPEKVAAKSKHWRKNNPDKVYKMKLNWNQKNPEKVKESHKKSYLKNRDQNKEKALKKVQLWRLNNPEKVKENRKKSWENTKNNPILKMIGIQRLRIRQLLNKQGLKKDQHTTEYLGCTDAELIQHLKSQFKNGMTLENHGQFGWHIDHIQPLSCFNLHDPEQRQIAFWYTNLQPLWWYENLTKGST